MRIIPITPIRLPISIFISESSPRMLERSDIKRLIPKPSIMTPIMPTVMETILAFLCSSVGTYFIYKNSDTTGAGDIMLNIQSLIKFPIPKINAELDNLSEIEINKYIYNVYGFTKDEILYIEKQI